jgi:hypothetical protein
MPTKFVIISVSLRITQHFEFMIINYIAIYLNIVEIVKILKNWSANMNTMEII